MIRTTELNLTSFKYLTTSSIAQGGKAFALSDCDFVCEQVISFIVYLLLFSSRGCSPSMQNCDNVLLYDKET
jgi:hypothetical protein